MKDLFEKNGFKIIKQAINTELSTFIHDYFLLKRQVAKTFFETKYISPYTEEYGVLGDIQCPNSYSHYADTAMEILLVWLKPLMEKVRASIQKVGKAFKPSITDSYPSPPISFIITPIWVVTSMLYVQPCCVFFCLMTDSISSASMPMRCLFAGSSFNRTFQT